MKTALEALKRYGDIRAIPAIDRTPVRDGDEGIYERHQKMVGLKKLNEKKRNREVMKRLTAIQSPKNTG